MASDRPVLPYGRQSLSDEDIHAVVEVLKGDFWTTGPAVDAFEARMSGVCDGAEAVAVSNGTTALHLAAVAAGVTADSLVVVPDITFVATANGARYTGAEVLVADVDRRTGLLGPEQLRAALDVAGRPVACVFVVHLAGQTADVTALRSVCEAHPNGRGARIVEDACHALGSTTPQGEPVGACHVSDLATFSFHPVKTVAAGEGGMVTCRSREVADRLRRLRSHGITRDRDRFARADAATSAAGGPNPWYYEAMETGFNYRLSDLQAALGASQLARLERFKAQRQALFARYARRLETARDAVRDRVSLIGRVDGCDPCWHLGVVQIDFSRLALDRAALMEELRARGVGSQVHYIPLHHHPALGPDAHPAVHTVPRLDGAAHYYATSLSLPLFHDMTQADVDRACDALFDLIEAAAA